MKNIFQDTTTETLTAATLDKLQKHRSIGKHIKKIQASDKSEDVVLEDDFTLNNFKLSS